MNKINFTIFTKPNGIMTKEINLVDGRIVKDGSRCWLSNGVAETIEVPFNDLPALLDTVKKNQAVSWGSSEHNKTKIVKQSKQASTPDAITRTQKHFDFVKGELGVLMIDDDTGMSTVDLIAAIEKVMPQLHGVARIERPSCSSDIYLDDKLLTSKDTGRIYLLVDDASQIPRVGEILHKRLILVGHGLTQITTSGVMLVRSLVDRSPASACGPGATTYRPISLANFPRPRGGRRDRERNHDYSHRDQDDPTTLRPRHSRSGDLPRSSPGRCVWCGHLSLSRGAESVATDRHNSV